MNEAQEPEIVFPNPRRVLQLLLSFWACYWTFETIEVVTTRVNWLSTTVKTAGNLSLVIPCLIILWVLTWPSEGGRRLGRQLVWMVLLKPLAELYLLGVGGLSTPKDWISLTVILAALVAIPVVIVRAWRPSGKR